MRAILKFDLEDFDDRMAHLRCVKSLDMAIVLFETLHNIERELVNDDSSDDFVNGVVSTIDKINELLDEHGLIIENIIE